MRTKLLAVAALLVTALPAQALPGQVPDALPVKDGRPAVATVNDDTIALDELVLQLERPEEATRLRQGRGGASDFELLDRLIVVRLVVQEAATMGLADLPEIRKQVDVSSRQFMRDVLMDRLVEDVKPDEAAIETLYRDLSREWRTSSILFKDQEAARRAREEIAGGVAYEQVAERAVAGQKAEAARDDAYHKQGEFLPPIAEAVAKLQAGEVSPLIGIEAGFVIVKVVDTRHADSAELRAQARNTVLKRQQQAHLEAHAESLRAEYVVVHEKVLDGLDYSAAEPGMDALLKDTRVIAEIKGADPLTVGDLTDYLRMQFFHGGDAATQGPRLNARKAAAFDATLGRRLLNMEAIRLGIDKTAAYVDRINAFEDSLVFDAFVQKVIVPSNRLREEEVKTYYDQHRGDFTPPAMLKVRGLAFTARAAAEAAIEKLRAGTDFGWLVSAADHQVEKDATGLLSFDGRPLTLDGMPDGVRRALADARAGDVRLYVSEEGHFYALAVQEVVATPPRTFDEVKDQIARKLYGEKLKKAVEDYAAKLRALAKVEIYLKKAE
jgi:parvulin-like peptidyl-prolyl isomerase